MVYSSDAMEERAALDAAACICAAARTAPKARGIDQIRTLALTGEDKSRLAEAMREIGTRMDMGFFLRDADNIDASAAVVLIGALEDKRALNEICGYCHHKNCADCASHGSACAMDAVDVGIALGSAAAMAADMRVDSRILFSAGRAAKELNLLGDGVGLIFALPISISGKSPYFDRKRK